MAELSSALDERYFSHILGAAAMRLLEQRLERLITPNNPAAGANFAVVVPGGYVWELLSVHYVFTSSAVVASRILGLDVLDQDLVRRARWLTTAGTAAGTAFDYAWDAGIGDSNETQGRSHSLPSPPYVIPGGWTLQSRTIALDVGDQYSAISIKVRAWSELDVIQEVQETAANFESLTQRLVGGGT